MSKSELLANNIDRDEVDKLIDRVAINSELINELTNQLVDDYCKNLNEYVRYVQDLLKDEQKPITSEELDYIVMELPILLYFCGEAQENLGIKTDVAKSVKQEKYNEMYRQVKGTIADKTAASELEAQSETITHIIYDRAYKIVKEKMTAAYELLSSCKKVISRRMTELEVTRLNEGRIRNGR